MIATQWNHPHAQMFYEEQYLYKEVLVEHGLTLCDISKVNILDPIAIPEGLDSQHEFPLVFQGYKSNMDAEYLNFSTLRLP